MPVYSFLHVETSFLTDFMVIPLNEKFVSHFPFFKKTTKSATLSNMTTEEDSFI